MLCNEDKNHSIECHSIEWHASACTKLSLAPMAGVTDLAFREIVREVTPFPVLCFSEMISAKALCYNDKKTYALLKTSPLDNPLSVQIFGSDPEIMAEAAKRIEASGFSMLDINAGCPAPKIVKNNEGSALTRDPELIFKIIEKIKKSTNLTVSLKTRLGYDKDNINIVKIAKLAEMAGCDFITIHGRTRDMYFSGEADYSYIKIAKENIKIPVYANGDVVNINTYNDIISKTLCDGVMVGRGAMGNPFIFNFIKNPDFFVKKEEKLSVLRRQIHKMSEYKDNAIKEARPHILWYLKGYKNIRNYKEKAQNVLTIKDVDLLISEILNDDSVI